MEHPKEFYRSFFHLFSEERRLDISLLTLTLSQFMIVFDHDHTMECETADHSQIKAMSSFQFQFCTFQLELSSIYAVLKSFNPDSVIYKFSKISVSMSYS